jgi:peptide-methionine (S)-S-oxide reductase
MVGSGRTRHAESIEVTYDPAKTSYGRILQIFFAVAHDPTQLNRQGPDYGPQYRSAIFYGNEEERRVAAAYIAQLEQAKVFSGRIVHGARAAQGLLPGRGLPPGLCEAESEPSVCGGELRTQGGQVAQKSFRGS